MTPDFVLSLFFEGIRLHRRTAEGWSLMGEVPLDSPDLARDLHALRDAGIATGTPWTGTRLLLPPEQVRVLDLEGERDLAGVRAALEGVTPYPVDDLVFDREVRDGRTHVAAVARETLEEAEAFAAEHGFLPLAFAASLSGFPREADFGPTRFSATLPAAAAPPADGPAKAAPPVTEAAHSAEAAPSLAPAEPAPEARPEPSEPVPQPQADAPPAPPLASSSLAPPEPPGPAPAVEAAPDAGPVVAAPAQPASSPADPSPEPPGDVAAPSATPSAEPIFASRARPLRAERPRPFDGPPTTRRPEGARVEPSVRKPPSASGEGWALGSPGTASRPDPRMPPRPPSTATRPGRPAGPLGSATEVLRAAPVVVADLPAPEPTGIPAPAAPALASASPALAASRPVGASRITPQIFEREEPAARPRGKPRFLGLILTVLLLIVMAAVFAWASTSEQGLAGLFRRADTPVAVVVAPPPEGTEAPSPAPPTTDPAAIVARPAPEPAPEALAGAKPAEPPSPDAEAVAAAAAAVAAAMADLPRAAEPPVASQAPADPADPLATAAAPADPAVPPAEADRFYAATGVWLRAPSLSPLPDAADASEAPSIPSPSAAQDPAEPPALAAVAPDARPEAPTEPAAPTEDAAEAVAPDAPSPDAVVAAAGPPTTRQPAGVNAMAGPPDVLPPERPEPPEGLTASTAEVQGPPAAGTRADGDEWINAMAEPPDALPPARPEAPAEFLEALAAQATAVPVQPGALAFAATPESPAPGGVDLAGLRPTPRPEDLAPPGGEPPPTVLASFDGPRPSPRPEGLAPEPEVESPDVSAALAEALAAPEAPEAPATPDVQSTLAAIVQGAPDPLAGATPRAVAVARVPDARPRNFDRVVQRQLDRVARASQAPAAGGVGTGGLTAQEQAEAAGEAEAASSAAAAPSGVTPTSVAQAATFSDAMRMREINLIGVYGQPNARRALIRLANGRYVRVGVGDQFDGGQVTAIGDNALNYTRRGRTFQLVIPGG